VGDFVNLEQSLKIGDKLSGHFVTGHIDCIGMIKRKGFKENNSFLEIAINPNQMRFIAIKGSIAVDGVSLTITEKKSNSFCVYLITHTLNNTILGKKSIGDKVNIEFDILSKYVAESHSQTIFPRI